MDRRRLRPARWRVGDAAPSGGRWRRWTSCALDIRTAGGWCSARTATSSASSSRRSSPTSGSPSTCRCRLRRCIGSTTTASDGASSAGTGSPRSSPRRRGRRILERFATRRSRTFRLRSRPVPAGASRCSSDAIAARRRLLADREQRFLAGRLLELFCQDVARLADRPGERPAALVRRQRAAAARTATGWRAP